MSWYNGAFYCQINEAYSLKRLSISPLLQKLLEILTECLNKASATKATSIALPAVGMGVKGYPSKIVAETLLQAAKVFAESNPNTTLGAIKLYLHKPSLKPSQLQV